MEQDDLIRTLVRDLRPVRRTSVGRALAAFALVSAASLLVFTRGGTAIAQPPAPAATALLAVLMAAAAAAAVGSAVPGRTFWRPSAALAGAALAAWMVHVALGAASLWPEAALLWGSVSWMKCFTFTLVFAIVPTAALVRLVRRGWTVQPVQTGLLTFAAGASAGALAIALECPSHAPLHMLLGHALPIVSAAALGAALATRVFARPAVPPHLNRRA